MKETCTFAVKYMMMNKAVKVPEELSGVPYYHSTLQFNRVTIVESCMQCTIKKNILFLEDHLLLFVLEGTHHVKPQGKACLIKNREF